MIASAKAMVVNKRGARATALEYARHARFLARVEAAGLMSNHRGNEAAQRET